MKIRSKTQYPYVTPIGLIHPGTVLDIAETHPAFKFFQNEVAQGRFEIVKEEKTQSVNLKAEVIVEKKPAEPTSSAVENAEPKADASAEPAKPSTEDTGKKTFFRRKKK